MRHIAMDQKSKEQPHPITANVQTDNPTPISLKGLWLQVQCCVMYKNLDPNKVNDKTLILF
ncbi:hypothetical protein CFP56_035163 [Quercus suber]|uniref:Uncharacterized protein n=2 Tax=Quercus suber TaxID=58331 RepID=A0AAW0LRV3_QUESU